MISIWTSLSAGAIASTGTYKCGPGASWAQALLGARRALRDLPLELALQASSGDNTAFRHPWLDKIRFSLNGVSRVRAYEMRSTEAVGFTL